MFNRKKNAQLRVMNSIEQQLRTFKHSYRGSYDHYLTRIEDAVFAEHAHPSILLSSLKVILQQYRDERLGQITFSRSTIIPFLETLIKSIRLEIIHVFVNDSEQPYTNLKHIANNFLRLLSDTADFIDQASVIKIGEIISDSINRFNDISDAEYSHERSFLEPLKKIYFSDDRIKNFISDHINLFVIDPLYYVDHFYRSYKKDKKIQNKTAFEEDFIRLGDEAVMSGRTLTSILALTMGDRLNIENYYSKLQEFLFFDDSYSDYFKIQLNELFCRHVNHASVSHLSKFWPMLYFSTGTKESRPPGIRYYPANQSTPIFFYPIRNGFGIVQKSGFQINKDPEYLSDSELFEQAVNKRNGITSYDGSISMVYELTLDSAYPNADNVTVRCIALRCELFERQCDEEISQARIQLCEKIQEKADLILPWQHIDVDISYFAYDRAIHQQDSESGFSLQKIAQEFCDIIRINYSSATPNTTKVDEMNALGDLIKRAIHAYKMPQKNTVQGIEALKQRLEAFKSNLCSEICSEERLLRYEPDVILSP